MIHNLKKLLKLTFIKQPLTKEFYLELLHLCIIKLRLLLFIFDLQVNREKLKGLEEEKIKLQTQKQNNFHQPDEIQSNDYVLNKEFFQNELDIGQKKQDLSDAKDIETLEIPDKGLDLAKIFQNIDILDKEEGLEFLKSDPCLKKKDFQRFLKKITTIHELISKTENFESHIQYGVDMDSEVIIRLLVKAGMIEEAVDFVVVSEIFAPNLLIYLSEVHYKLSKGLHHEKYNKQMIWEYTQKILINCNEDRQKEYCRVFADKILRNHLQKNVDEDIPAQLKEFYLSVDPSGLVLLYLKYKKNEVLFFIG